MRHTPAQIFFATIVYLMASTAWGTARFFSDIVATSANKRYLVEAKSSDNAKENGRRAFQASFVYTCRDTHTQKLLWTRKQPMKESERSPGETGSTYFYPEESSPVSIFVSDDGWTVIRTDADDLISVDITGKDRGSASILSDAFTKDEFDKYVQETTAGPMWSGYSLWYFLANDDQSLFVMRPWWGRRVYLNLETGNLFDAGHDIPTDALAYERIYVLDELKKGVARLSEMEKEHRGLSFRPVRHASYLAGRLGMTEAIPFLEALQKSNYAGSSSSGGLGMFERFENEVNPHDYSTYTFRQVVHLSLRRLGAKPHALPLTEFDVQFEDYNKHFPYKPAIRSVPRADHVDKVHVGMKAEQVLDLIGAPDFVGYACWDYDIDTKEPFTLTLKWDVRQVIDIQRKTPALWQKGFTRDFDIVQ